MKHDETCDTTAVVAGTDVRRVERYLPANYHVTGYTVTPNGREVAEVCGRDLHGWTMEDYVIPRLASGLLYVSDVRRREAEPLHVEYLIRFSLTVKDEASDPGGWGLVNALLNELPDERFDEEAGDGWSVAVIEAT